MPSAENAIIARSPDGVTNHDMGTGWRVIVARRGERVATWYHHVNDDKRLAESQMRDAERRFISWQREPQP